jgi:hypothetical protein
MAALPAIYERIFSSQARRPSALKFFDLAVPGIYGLRVGNRLSTRKRVALPGTLV